MEKGKLEIKIVFLGKLIIFSSNKQEEVFEVTMTSIKSILMIGQAVVGAYLISKAVVEIWNSSVEVDLKSPAIEIEQVVEALEEELFEDDYDAGDCNEMDEDEDLVKKKKIGWNWPINMMNTQNMMVV